MRSLPKVTTNNGFLDSKILLGPPKAWSGDAKKTTKKFPSCCHPQIYDKMSAIEEKIEFSRKLSEQWTQSFSNSTRLH